MKISGFFHVEHPKEILFGSDKMLLTIILRCASGNISVQPTLIISLPTVISEGWKFMKHG